MRTVNGETEITRAVVVFPAFADPMASVQIADMRRRFDPLVTAIPAHLTLVFPFTSTLSTDALVAHIGASTRGIAPFSLTLRDIRGSEGEYLFLAVKRGNDEVIALHDRLYTGLLAEHRSREHTFVPHLTVGRLSNPEAFRAALDTTCEMTASWEARVREISIYRISPRTTGTSRNVECAMPLGGCR